MSINSVFSYVQDLKISLITVTFNAAKTIERCIQSVVSQNYTNIEYIIIDGGSTDATAEIAGRYKNYIHLFLSEPDNGIYDAMNKGIALATGDVLGMINADDYFADCDILSIIALSFYNSGADIVYGDLDYVDKKGRISRKWRSGKYKKGIFNKGWMPPHPTFYCKRSLFNKLGCYSLEYGTAADYELMLRFMHPNIIQTFYVKRVMIKMMTGGVSNQSYSNRFKVLKADLKAMRNNGIRIPIATLILKPLRKVIQFI